MSKKIIQFPRNKVVRQLPEEHLKARKEKEKQKLADAIVDEIVDTALTEMDNCMVEVTEEQFQKDFVMVIDAIRACVYRSHNIEHPLHEFVDNNVTVVEGNEVQPSKDELKTKIDELVQGLNEARKKLDENE